MLTRISIMSCFVVTALLVGCSSDPVATPPAGRADPFPSQAYPQISATDGLDEWLFFGESKITEPSTTSPMHVEVPVRSRAGNNIAVQYQFEFYDRDKRLLTRSESWRYMMMQPRIEYRFTGTGTDPNTYDWRMVVRSAR